MNNRSISLTVLSLGLGVIYGLGTLIYLPAYVVSFYMKDLLSFPIFFGRFDNIEAFRHYSLIWVIYLPQFIGFVGLFFRKEWGRRLIVLMGIVMCAVYSARVYQTEGTDTLISVAIFIYIALILFLMRPEIREEFSSGSFFNGKTVLVIDDDRGFLKMIRAFLVSKGYMVLTALTGEKGLKIARSHSPDLILLDVILPKVKGREVCGRLKEDQKTKHIPVIFLTAKDSPDDVRAELDLGAEAHITKPIDYPMLMDAMTKALDGL